jgi:DNA-binding NtrC family response regulator
LHVTFHVNQTGVSIVDLVSRAVGIADGDERWLARLKAAIERLGYPVFAVPKGKDLLIPLRDGELAVLIVDTRLEDVSGLELVSLVREMDTGFPIVITTSDYSRSLELACRKMGIIFYARKPLNFEVIRWIVKRHMTLSEEKDELVTKTSHRG